MPDASHLQRDRAESFGSIAADYDRYRPGYPAELIADLMELLAVRAEPRVLDVGCGTGKAGRLLADRGTDVLGVEIDAQMADVARGHGLAVEVGSFETWDDDGRTFDLVISAQAWHWVDPAVGAPKAARLLRPGGRVALFWNFDDLLPPWQAAVDKVYAVEAPDLAQLAAHGASRRDDRPYVVDLQASGAFASVETHTYPWERSVPLDVWIGRCGTQSNHVLLGRPRLDRLLSALRTALVPLGDVQSRGGTYTIIARP